MKDKPKPGIPGEWDEATIQPFQGIMPDIAPSAFLAAGARIIGDVVLGAEASVWYNAVIRGDVHSIRIGRRTNVQDNVTIHATYQKYSTQIGEDVTIGHNAILHGCTVEDLCLIGMGSIVMDDAVIGTGSLVAAGTLVSPGTKVPPGSLVIGVPGKIRRQLRTAETEALTVSAQHYLDYVRRYRQGK